MGFENQVVEIDNLCRYSPVERLFYGDDSYDNLVQVFTKCPEGMLQKIVQNSPRHVALSLLLAINDSLECYNKMSWACLCVEETRLKDLK